MQRNFGKQNGENIQETNYVRLNLKWMIPFHPMDNVVTKILFCADYIEGS